MCKQNCYKSMRNGYTKPNFSKFSGNTIRRVMSETRFTNLTTSHSRNFVQSLVVCQATKNCVAQQTASLSKKLQVKIVVNLCVAVVISISPIPIEAIRTRKATRFRLPVSWTVFQSFSIAGKIAGKLDSFSICRRSLMLVL